MKIIIFVLLSIVLNFSVVFISKATDDGLLLESTSSIAKEAEASIKVFIKAKYILGAAIHASGKKYTDDRYKGEKNFLLMTNKLKSDAIALTRESESLPEEVGVHLTAAITFTAVCVSTYRSYDSCTTAKDLLKEIYWNIMLGDAVKKWSGRDRYADWEGFPDSMK